MSVSGPAYPCVKVRPGILHFERERVLPDQRSDLIVVQRHSNRHAIPGRRDGRLAEQLRHIRVVLLGFVLLVHQAQLQQLPQRVGVFR